MIPTKEVFVEIINSIQEQDKIDNEIGKSLEKVCGSYILYQTENKIYNSLFKLLGTVFDDMDIIEWWLYEDVKKDIKCNNIVYSLDTPEALYDYLLLQFSN